MILERLPQREQRTVAIGILVFFLLIVYFVMIDPIVTAHQDYDDRLAQLKGRLASYQKIAGEGEALQQQYAQLKKQAGKEQAGYFTGGTHALVLAKVQDYVKQLIEENGGRLNSIQILSDKGQEKETPRVMVRVQMSGGIETVQKVLYALESNQPRLFVDNLYLHGISSHLISRGKSSNDEQLNIRFDLTGFIQPMGA